MPLLFHRAFRLLLGLAGGAAPLAAQEVSAMGGVSGSESFRGSSYSWQLDYRYPLGDHFAWSAAWINEGHLADHHRDGLALEAWAILLSQPQEFSLAIGAGTYNYADTHLLSGNGYTNDHGWTPIFSVSATYYTDSPWFLRMTGNHLSEADGLESNTVVVGLGYQFGWRRADAALRATRQRAANAITFMAGRTIVNSRSSEHATAKMAEYRKALGAHWDWTVSWINEGDPQVLRRNGAATQLWLVDVHPPQQLGFGLGVGPYYSFQRTGPSATVQTEFSMLVSPTVVYRLAQHWQARLTWNRVVSPDDRDTDVIVLGLGYRWGAK